MKYLLLLIVFMLPEADKTGLLIKENIVFLSISRESTEEELMEYKKTLLDEKSIVITYEKLKFTKDGMLKYIRFTVDCQDGIKGTYNSTLMDKRYVGFYRIYNKRVTTPFAVGTMPPMQDYANE